MQRYLLRILFTFGVISAVYACVVLAKRFLLPANIGTSPIPIVTVFVVLLAFTGACSLVLKKQFHWIGAIVLTTAIILIDAIFSVATRAPIAAPATPTVTPAASNGYVYLKIATKDVQQRTGALLAGQPAQLVIVTDLDATPTPAIQRAQNGAVRECVTVSALLDSTGGWSAANLESAADILLLVKSESLPSVVYGLAHADQIWVATDPACAGDQ